MLWRTLRVAGLLLWVFRIRCSETRRTFKELPTSDIEALINLSDPGKTLDWTDGNTHLAKILIPRAPDTTNNTFVRNHLADSLRALDWLVEEDEFIDSTPYGTKRFVNLIATKNPHAPQRLILAAHFDSKFFPSSPHDQFIGATDSAAPCAILLDVAAALNPWFQSKDRAQDATTLQLVFFDGEEAFKDWTAADSLYGSRHLAKKWASSYVASHSARRLNPSATELSGIEHLVLLDLLGARDPLIQSYFPSTAWLFDKLVSAERRLGEIGAFDPPALRGNQKWTPWSSFFVPRTSYEAYTPHIEDDHIPFLTRGVNVLHVIASPFPRVWHTLADDASALDLPTLTRWSLLFRIFTAEYLGLRPELKTAHERDGAELVSSE